jgi:hypothetical protein
MKTILHFTVLALAFLSMTLLGQQPKLRKVQPKKLKIISEQKAREYMMASTAPKPQPGAATAAAAGAVLPVFTYSIKAAQDKKTYTGSIVGGNALAGAQGTTTVPTLVVPVVLNIKQGGVTFTFDPSANDDGCLGAGNSSLKVVQASPIFKNAPTTLNGVSVGITQYLDAFQRAQFFTKIGPSYHLLLNPTTVAPLTISLDGGASGNATAEVVSLGGTQCGSNTGNLNSKAKLAIVNVDTIDAALQDYMVKNKVTPAQFPFFLIYNSVMASGAANDNNACCILGYHNALSNKQTYSISDFEGRFNTAFKNTGDISTAIHELAEWANDPFGDNATPPWGRLGQVSACQDNLETGDPLSGSLAPSIALNGFTYHPQELAFFSWFFGGTSLGTGKKYSSNKKFGGPAKLCPPGGTN